MATDDIEFQFLSGLYGVELSVLVTVGSYLKVDCTGKTKRQLLKEIRSHLEAEITEDTATSVYRDLLAIVQQRKGLPPLEGEDVEAASSHLSTPADQALSPLSKPAENVSDFTRISSEKEELEKRLRELNMTLSLSQSAPPSNSPSRGEERISYDNFARFDAQNTLLRREFKISGTIGNAGETNKLSFISLAHQIEAALAKGYTEGEVRDAVIKSISPGMSLRNFLECTPDISLSKLRKILRSHYQEKSSTELHKALSTITQHQSEGPQSFLLRALELRQRVIFTSKEADSHIKYNEDIIQSLFLHAVETGLRNETVRAKLRPFLLSKDVADEDLMCQINIICSQEHERELKLGRKHVHAVSTGTVPPKTGTEIEAKSFSRNENTEEFYKATLNAVQNSLKELKTSFEEFKEQSVQAPKKKFPQTQSIRKACPSCVEQGSMQKCQHCFICGDASHIARGCAKRRNPKNGNKLQWNRD